MLKDAIGSLLFGNERLTCVIERRREKFESELCYEVVDKTVILRATRQYLEKLGVLVDFDSSFTSDCSCYDLVHLFNMTHPYKTKLQMVNAKRQGKPVCLSTIYWNTENLRNEIASSSSVWAKTLRYGSGLLRLVNNLIRKETRYRCFESRVRENLTHGLMTGWWERE